MLLFSLPSQLPNESLNYSLIFTQLTIRGLIQFFYKNNFNPNLND